VEREYHAFEALIIRLRAENETLKAGNEQLRRESQAIMPQPPRLRAADQGCLWQRLTAFLRRKS
jgi:hypothetical protein